jgi:2-(1,2-epoxy-1,2-dihydrophenyl)acetyl-CoA isomerase
MTMTRTIDTGTSELLCSVTDHVATITFNRPEKRNALGDEMTPAFREMLLVTEADPDVRVVVVTGAGKGFCAGGDVSSMGSRIGSRSDLTVDAKIRLLQHAQETCSLRLHEMSKPTIAALPGAAAGAGMSLALACDLRIAAESAFLAPAFGAIGLSGDYGGSWYLSKLIGPGRAKEMYFTNRRMNATEALALGVFNRVVPDETLRDAAQAMAAEIAQGAPVALRYMKENHNRAMVSDLKTTMAMEGDRMVRAMHTEDFANAAAAFLAKQKPVFKGK